jgi:hypothetical protein
MSLLVTFAGIMIAGLSANILLAIELEKHFKPAGLPLFFILGALLIVGGWRLAVRLTAPAAGSGSDVRPKDAA